ncbi:radical SAM family heme chaperone HemW [Algivirga pacifica]|uniref:Heme chaperone HemW n=1 Tax=Algivirga pacifica TaxID=1162670 RepID=A0ABP9D1P1_9BACT
MSGIYIHIPFCKQACYYCDFHFSTNLKLKTDLVQAIVKELEMQQYYLGNPSQLKTLYFGGGTPSLLSKEELQQIMEAVEQYYDCSMLEEITLEANPDDLNASKLQDLAEVGINRLSIGIQSFHDPFLKMMHRAHNAQEADTCVKLAQDAGIENISIDLIYGIPADTHQYWEEDLQKAMALKVPHISSYCLTIEEKTVLGNWTKKGRFKPAEDEFSATQFERLLEVMKENGYEHYEISNFAQPGMYSKHNTAYWQQKKYLGIGPAAHSYNGQSRQYNIANNSKYTQQIHQGIIPAEREQLTVKDQVNEYLLTTLRTMWGSDMAYIKNTYQVDIPKQFQAVLKDMEQKGWIRWKGSLLQLTENGKLMADMVSENLFLL